MDICLRSGSHQKICVYFKFVNDRQHVLSNFGDTFYLVRKFVIYYVPNSIKVRFKNKNTCDICKISKQRKVTNTPPIFSNYLNQQSLLRYISILKFYLNNQQINLL